MGADQEECPRVCVPRHRGKWEKPAGNRPVITYFTRQTRGKALAQEDYEGLVDARQDLETKYGYGVHIVVMENLSKSNKFKLAGGATVSNHTL